MDRGAGMVATITVEDFGPFEHAKVELRPLTVFIGKNSSGKSTLMRLAWALTWPPIPFIILSILPTLITVVSEGEKNVIDGIINDVGRGLKPSWDDVRAVVKSLVEDLRESIRIYLRDRIKGVFGMELDELVRIGAKSARVNVANQYELTISIEGNDLRLERLSVIDDVLNNELVITVPRPGTLGLGYDEFYVERPLITNNDFTALIVETLRYSLESKYGSLPPLTVFLPDSKAGILRQAERPLYRSLLPSFIRYYWATSDVELVIYTLHSLIGLINDPKMLESALNIAKDLLNELGCELVLKPEDAHMVYVRTWTGKELPLYQAPSGMRESAMITLSLALPLGTVFIEEPESHLHPKAIKSMARLIARAINGGKTIIVSTHSDYLISALSNLIAASRIREGARKLGIDESETIDLDKVSVYLVRRGEDGKALVNRLEVADAGILEDELTRVAEELLDEQAGILDELQKRGHNK
jgi:energy-coupling factor transporter ATP-binding protein EcfA2